MKSAIAVAISGGIDSLVAAYLLKKTYNNVFGLHFLTGFEQTSSPVSISQNYRLTETEGASVVEAPEDHPIFQISQQLSIPVFLIDCRNIFKKKVIDYFIDNYLAGKTPNPCMVCNPEIKFRIILRAAQKLGSSHLATGHYAKIGKKSNGLYQLKKGADSNKDQSYFLALLSQEQLSSALFPLGEMTKKQTVELAMRQGLSAVLTKESQDICFIRNEDYSQFLTEQENFTALKGPIKNRHGEILGHHNGLHQFTIGQRRGINCPASEPYYVLKINAKENTLVVGFKKELYRSELTVSNMNWIASKPLFPIKVKTRIRYRHLAAPSILIPISENRAVIQFDKPQAAIAPGQAAVCYHHDDIICGGFIDE
ncbi:MAG: tRNA 2-thiouridine(34) synthase MnmA [Desulfobacterales bacterium]|nr:tRNA 2-thiouridine(34) synthase MnmA [Desulfobacterales bacterium]